MLQDYGTITTQPKLTAEQYGNGYREEETIATNYKSTPELEPEQCKEKDDDTTVTSRYKQEA